MSSSMMFGILLIFGIVLLVVGKVLENRIRIVLYLLGAALVVFGGYGVFTSFF